MEKDNIFDYENENIEFQKLQIQADQIMDNIKKMDIQFIKSIVHPP